MPSSDLLFTFLPLYFDSWDFRQAPSHSVLNSAVNGIQEFAQPWQVLYQKSYIPRSKSFITTIWEGGSGINGLVRLRKHRQNHKALDLGSMNSKQLLEERRLAMVELLCRID